MAAANSIARKAPDNETIAITAAAGQSIRLNSTPANPPPPPLFRHCDTSATAKPLLPAQINYPNNPTIRFYFFFTEIKSVNKAAIDRY